MAIWQVLVLVAMSGCMIGCLWNIFKSIEKLSKVIFSIGTELRKINAKLERIEAVSSDDAEKPTGAQKSDAEAIEAIEAALSNFENLKKIDLTNPQESK